MTLRTVLIGFGTAGELFHAPLIAATAGLTLAAVVTTDPVRRERVRRAHPDAALLDGAAAGWADPGRFDLVVVATPNATHEPLATAAVDAGLPVVVDKPLAPTADAARALVARAAAAGVPLTVYQNRRWDGDFRTVARLLDHGAVGTPVRLESRFERWRPALKEGSWKESADPQQAGGLLLDLGSHLVDQALTLFGPAATVYAEIGAHRRHSTVDDDVFVALTHRSGVHSHLWMSAVAGQLGPRFRLLGDGGAYVSAGMDPQEAALRAGRRPGSPGWGDRPAAEWGTLGAGDAVRPYRTLSGDWGRFYALLVTALTDGGPLPVDPADAVAALAVLDAARRSAAGGGAVRLDGP